MWRGMRVDNIVEDGVDDFGCCGESVGSGWDVDVKGNVQEFGEVLEKFDVELKTMLMKKGWEVLNEQ